MATQAKLNAIVQKILADDEIFYDGIAEEVYAQVTYKDGRREKWHDISIIKHIGKVDSIVDTTGNIHHQLSELKALGIVDVEIRYVHKVFGFAEDSDA